MVLAVLYRTCHSFNSGDCIVCHASSSLPADQQTWSNDWAEFSQ